VTDPWADPAYLRGAQYKTDTNLAARQSIYAYQYPRIDLAARVLDLAGPVPPGPVADIGCGNGLYLAELARRGLGPAVGRWPRPCSPGFPGRLRATTSSPATRVVSSARFNGVFPRIGVFRTCQSAYGRPR
jgi:hypothetical protein